jgi:4-hydroxybenzoate polyprenyltransferase
VTDEPLAFDDDERGDKPPRSRFDAVLAMLRPPNLPTAWADILLGYWMIQWDEPWGNLATLALLLLATSGLYLAGMVWNDVFDVETDRRERPDRPIPSGDVSLPFARTLATILTLLGIGAAALAGIAPLVVALVLTVAVLFYDAFAKNYPFGPLAMGLCRALNVLLGVSLALPAIMRISGAPPQLLPLRDALVWSTYWWSFPLGNGLYIAGATLLSRQEVIRGRRAGVLAAAVVMATGFATHAWSLSQIPRLESAVWIVGGFAALTVGFRLLRAAVNPSPRMVQTAVGSAIVSLIMIDAALLLAVRGQMQAMAVVCLLPLSVFFARWYYST